MILQLVKDMIYAFVKRTFVLCFIAVSSLYPFANVNAQQTATFTQNFGSFNVSENEIIISTNYSGADTLIFSFTDKPAYGNSLTGEILQYRCFNSQCSNPFTFNSLQANKNYIVATGANFGTSATYYDTVWSTLSNISTLGTSGLNTFAYFETDDNAQIKCASESFGNNAGEHAFFSCENVIGTQIPAGQTYIPPRFTLLASGTSPTDLSAAVISGVQKTGNSIWPMFAFVGVSLAFIIALQVVVFTKRAVNGSERKNDATKYNKLPRTGDYKAFKRGRRKNKADGIDLFPKK